MEPSKKRFCSDQEFNCTLEISCLSGNKKDNNIQILIENDTQKLTNSDNIKKRKISDKSDYKLPPFLSLEKLITYDWFKVPKEDDSFIKSPYINCGGTSIVIKVIERNTKTPFAIKIFNDDTDSTYDNEVDILTTIKDNGGHPNIINFYSHGIIDTKVLEQFEIPFYLDYNYLIGRRYILQEWVEGLELLVFVQNNNIQQDYSKNIIKEIIKQIIKGIRWVNLIDNSSIKHLDIKLENIMISFNPELKIKIIDWGLATKDKKINSMVGSKYHLSPEMFKVPIEYYDSQVSQIWSLGITIYSLVFNCFPFEKANKKTDKVFNQFCYFQQEDQCPNKQYDILFRSMDLKLKDQYSDIIELIKKMLIVDPCKRLNCLKDIKINLSRY